MAVCIHDWKSKTISGEVAWKFCINCNELEFKSDDGHTGYLRTNVIELTPITDTDLATAKTLKIDSIQSRTRELIQLGMSFDSEVFPLHERAIDYYEGIEIKRDSITWPFTLTTLDNKAYSLAEADLTTFTNIVLGTIDAHEDSGRLLIIDVDAATTVAEVDAVVDNR